MRMLDDHSPVVKILDASWLKQALLLKTALVGKAARCLASLAITTFDNGTDILLAIEYFQRGETSWGATTLAFPLLSNLCQSLLAVADGDHPFIVLAALVGLKPFIDTWRAITGAEQGKRKLRPVLSMALNRGIEIVLNRCRRHIFSNDSDGTIGSCERCNIHDPVLYSNIVIFCHRLHLCDHGL